MDSASSTAPQPSGLPSIENGPPIAQQPNPIALTAMPDLPKLLCIMVCPPLHEPVGLLEGLEGASVAPPAASSPPLVLTLGTMLPREGSACHRPKGGKMGAPV